MKSAFFRLAHCCSLLVRSFLRAADSFFVLFQHIGDIGKDVRGAKVDELTIGQSPGPQKSIIRVASKQAWFPRRSIAGFTHSTILAHSSMTEVHP